MTSPHHHPLELSYTKVKTYLNCPWLYKLRFLDDWKAPPSPQASLGLSLHKALERFHGQPSFDLENCLLCLDEVWNRAGYANTGEEFDYYDKARLILEVYFNRLASPWKGAVLFLEKDFALELPQLDIRLIGLVDRIDRLSQNVYALIEYKTHAQAWDEERLNSDLQMTFYAKACEAALGLKPLRLYFFFVAQGIAREVARSDNDWSQALHVLEKVAAKIRNNDFEPDTRYCGFCELNKVCKYSVVKGSD